MKCLVIILAILVVLMFYPARIALKSKLDNNAYVEVNIFLLPFSKKKITVFKLDKKDIFQGIMPTEPNNKSKGEKVGDIIESIPIDWEKLKAEKLNRDKQKENDNIDLNTNQPVGDGLDRPETLQSVKTTDKKQKPKKSSNLEPKDFLPYLKPMLEKILGVVNLERLKIMGNLSGDPAICAMLGGSLWGILSVAFGVLSTKVNKFPKDHLLKVTLMEEKPHFIEADIQVYLRLYGAILVAIYTLKIFLKLKWQKRKITK